jgi:hypothetical protein
MAAQRAATQPHAASAACHQRLAASGQGLARFRDSSIPLVPALRFATQIASRFRDRAVARRVVSLLTLLTFLIAYFPIPVPVLRGTASNEAFPCQGGRCGCDSAKQCWTSCCCLSPRERKAWAEREGVAPPEYAVLDEADASGQPSGEIAGSCCAPKAVANATPAKTSCCASSESCDTPVAPNSAEVQETRYTLTVAAMKCRGAASDFNSLMWFVWHAPTLTIIGDHGVDLDQRIVDERAASFAADLVSPPPRTA